MSISESIGYRHRNRVRYDFISISESSSIGLDSDIGIDFDTIGRRYRNRFRYDRTSISESSSMRCRQPKHRTDTISIFYTSKLSSTLSLERKLGMPRNMECKTRAIRYIKSPIFRNIEGFDTISTTNRNEPNAAQYGTEAGKIHGHLGSCDRSCSWSVRQSVMDISGKSFQSHQSTTFAVVPGVDADLARVKAIGSAKKAIGPIEYFAVINRFLRMIQDNSSNSTSRMNRTDQSN